jgi:hypothetical protein
MGEVDDGVIVESWKVSGSLRDGEGRLVRQ